MTTFRSLRMKPVIVAGLLLGLGLAISTAPAFAQRGDEMRGGGQNPCTGDAHRLCNQFIPDRSKVASCLFRNKRHVTPACRVELGGGKASASKARKHKHKHKHKRHGRRHHHHH